MRSRSRLLVLVLSLTAALAALAPAASADPILDCTPASGGPKGWQADCDINLPFDLG